MQNNINFERILKKTIQHIFCKKSFQNMFKKNLSYNNISKGKLMDSKI